MELIQTYKQEGAHFKAIVMYDNIIQTDVMRTTGSSLSTLSTGMSALRSSALYGNTEITECVLGELLSLKSNGLYFLLETVKHSIILLCEI